MITAYWITFAVGLTTLIVWILMRGLAHAEVLVRFDPEQRVPTLKLAVAGMLGFGMAGLSSSYAGWDPALTIGGALAGAGAAAWYAHWVDEDMVEDIVEDTREDIDVAHDAPGDGPIQRR